jgi:hypothetical protein
MLAVFGISTGSSDEHDFWTSCQTLGNVARLSQFPSVKRKEDHRNPLRRWGKKMCYNSAG